MDTSKMTDEEIGRMVAEKIMQWHIVYVAGYSISHFIGGHYNTVEECELACKMMVNERPGFVPIALYSTSRNTSFGYGPDNWNPCQNIEQAFRVVEKMAEIDFRFEIYRWSDADMHNLNKWGCKFESGDIEFCTYSDNPARAICEAALKAVE